MKRFNRLMLLVGVVLLLTVVSLTEVYAQGINGTLRGLVKDQNGAVIPNATVTVTNEETALTRTQTTTEAGWYVFPNLPVGTYTVKAEAANFAPVERRSVKVSLTADTSVDLTLGIGQVTQQIQVIGEGEQIINPSDSTVDTTYTNREVLELPSSPTGNILLLSLTAPATNNAGAGMPGIVSTGGQRGRNNNFTLDGVDNNDPSVTGAQVPVIQDAVQEFTFLQNVYSAEFGRNSGGQLNVITRSGTNNWHGSMFGYLQNRHLNARNNFEEQSVSGAKNRFDRWRVGATSGFPIIRDKLFFFGAYQYETQGQAEPGNPLSTFTPATLANLRSRAQAGTLFPNPSGIGSLPLQVQGINLLENFVPVPTSNFRTVTLFPNTAQAFQAQVGDFIVPSRSFFNQHSFQTNVDYSINTSHQLAGRFLWDRFREFSPATLPGFPAFTAVDSRLLSVNLVSTLSSRIVNEARFSWRRQVNDFPLANPNHLSFPNFTIFSGPIAGLEIGPSGVLPQSGRDNIYQFADNVSLTHGRHTIRTGLDFRAVKNFSDFLPRSRGDYFFPRVEDLLQNTISSPGFALKGIGSGVFDGDFEQFFLFIQDDIKVTPKFTLNLGLRYELATPAEDNDLQALNAPASIPGVIEFGPTRTDKNNIAPRLGFAYDMFGTGNTVVRGGGGVFYDLIFNNLPLLSLPPDLQSEANNNSALLNFISNVDPAGRVTVQASPSQFPLVLPAITSVEQRRSLIGGLIPINQKTPYAINWFLDVQQALNYDLIPSSFKDMVLTLRYQGSRGVQLPRQIQRNPFIKPTSFLPTFFSGNVPAAAVLDTLPTLPQLQASRPGRVLGVNANGTTNGFLLGTPVTDLGTGASSIYHAGIVRLQKRFAHNLTFDTSYTFSKLIDNNTEPLFTSFATPRRPQDFSDLSTERSLSASDFPHRWVASFLWELPFFNEQSGVMKTLLGGWQLNGIVTVQSGQPYTPQNGTDSNLNADSAGDRPFLNPTPTNPTNQFGRPTFSAVNPVRNTAGAIVGYVPVDPGARFIQAGLGAGPGNVGRNVLRTETTETVDFSVFKNFRIDEAKNIQFRTEFFNLFNHRNYGVPVTAGGAANTGLTRSFVTPNANFGNPFIGFANGRIIQIALKLQF